MSIFAWILLLCVALAISFLAKGYALCLLWRWFVMSKYKVQELSLLVAMVFVFAISVVTHVPTLDGAPGTFQEFMTLYPMAEILAETIADFSVIYLLLGVVWLIKEGSKKVRFSVSFSILDDDEKVEGDKKKEQNK